MSGDVMMFPDTVEEFMEQNKVVDREQVYSNGTEIFRMQQWFDHVKHSPDEVRGVVHCGECDHADKDMSGAIYCKMWDAWEVPEDGFCYKGAKMEVSENA